MKKRSFEEFVTIACEIHKNKFTYDEQSYNSQGEKIIIYCPIHGGFEQTISNHLKGKGCPYCYGKKRRTTEEFIQIAQSIHGDKYDYSKVEYINDRTKVCIICPRHGEFWMTPSNHIHKCRPQNCPLCSHPSQKKTRDQFILDAKLIHGNKYDYSKIEYINNKTPLVIICPIHGEFEQKPTDHLRGCGCPKCKSSKLEMSIIKVLDNNNIEYIYQYRPSWLDRQSLDFYIPSLNLGIECQGEQHYKEVSFGGHENTLEYRQNLDLNKKILCEENGITILYFAKEQYADNIITDKKLLLEKIKSYAN